MTPGASKLLIGLIGSGIQRSLTPAMQEEEARHHGLRLHYQLIDLDQTAGADPERMGQLFRQLLAAQAGQASRLLLKQ